MIRLIKKSQGVERAISPTYKVTNLLTGADSESVSVAVSQAAGHKETTKNTKSDRVYFVLEGKLVVDAEGKHFEAGPGDTIFIPKDTRYTFSGTFKAVLINTPAFDPSSEVIESI